MAGPSADVGLCTHPHARTYTNTHSHVLTLLIHLLKFWEGTTVGLCFPDGKTEHRLCLKGSLVAVSGAQQVTPLRFPSKHLAPGTTPLTNADTNTATNTDTSVYRYTDARKTEMAVLDALDAMTSGPRSWHGASAVSSTNAGLVRLSICLGTQLEPT